ncbi:MAG TPA: prolyl oligopeptidase family serine peptidase [Burkholderiaceae bacterium]|nr:prolyl oligopeptidase family serine peptidase [Burkholderiaceae bacterium]HQR69600.1 prolyl oligopeptidase family serine peptidase [Burkholderiaceae bacterium]
MALPRWTRRRALAALGALPASLSLPAFAASAAKPAAGPPVARKQPVKETLWGEEIVDPYRWMEDPKDAEWESFMKGQAAYARRVLDSIPGRKALFQRVTQLSGEVPIAQAPQMAGKGRLFYQMRPSGANQFKLYMRDGVNGAEKLLVDPSTLRGPNDVHMSLDWWLASPDGRYVVYGLSPAGSENSVAQILEVDVMKVLPERIDRTQYANPSWLPDSSGFFIIRLAEGAKLGSQEYYLDSVAWLHRLGTDPKDDVRVLSRGQFAGVPLERNEFPGVAADPSSRHVVAVVAGGVRRENPLYVATLESVLARQPQWRKVCDVADEVTGFAFRGDELYLQTTRNATNAKVLKTSLSAPDLARAATVVPEGDTVIEAIAIARDGLYVRDMDGGYNGLRRLGNDGRLQTIKLPFEGSFESMSTDTREDGVWMLGTSWLLPFTVFRHDPAANSTAAVPLAPPPSLDLSKFEAIRSFAKARDGTRVPLSIVAKKGMKRDGRNPTLVNAYGAYQISMTPYFNARGIAFLEQGGVLAYAHVRGGGEYGKRWWRSGQKLTKPNTWRDLIDCCEELIRQKWTSSKRLTIQGGSAGGITVGRALTERPDLFTAVISNVGVSNALRAEFSQNGPPNIDEFGTVTERGGFLGLKQMDAYHAVRDGVHYPAVLLTTGITDPRVEPWQVAKMAARLQEVVARLQRPDRNPVLLRVDFEAGHGLGSTRQQADAERADEYAFALWRSGIAGFQPKAA